jgi:sugar lactone lactonase YvrE
MTRPQRTRRFGARTGLTAALIAAFAACSGSDADPLYCSDEPGVACTWAGVKHERGGPEEDGTLRTETDLNFVIDLTFTSDGRAWVADFNNHRIRMIDTDGTMHTVLGADYEGDGPPGETDRLPIGDPVGADALTVAMNHPSDILFSPDENTMYVAAWHNNKIRVLDLATGMVTVLAGDSYGFAGDGEPAYMAVFNQPKSLVWDDAGNLYTNDQRNQRIRMISADTGIIDTIAGTGEVGSTGDGGPGLQATFSFDTGTTPTPSGGLAIRGRELYIADSMAHRIRMLDLDSGIINAVAGTGTAGYSGDGGQAMDAEFHEPFDMEFGPDGRLYVVDAKNNAVRAIDLDSGIVETVAGNGQQCDDVIYCYEEMDEPLATEVQLLQPWGVEFDPAGDMYIADTNNQRIVKVNQ